MRTSSCLQFLTINILMIAGAKVSANSKHIRIIEKTGTSLVLESEQNQQHLTENTKNMLDYVRKVRHIFYSC